MEVDGKRVEPTFESGENCEPCQRGNTTTKAVGLCIECEEYMCQTCFDHHLKAKICMNHNLVDDLKSSMTGRSEDVERCKEHDSEIVKYYCCTHKTVGCGDCMLSGGHNACKPENIKHLAKNFKNEKAFKDIVKQVEDIEKDKNLIEKINRDNQRKIKEVNEKAVSEVRKFRTDVNNFLDEAEANILSKIKSVTSENHEQMAIMGRAIESISIELDDVRQKLDTELHDGNVLFINAVACKPQLKNIALSVANAKSKKVLKNFKFYPDEDLSRIAASGKSFGDIQISLEGSAEIIRPQIVEEQTDGIQNIETAENSGAEFESNHEEEDCMICMDQMKNTKTLKCGHTYCSECIDAHFEIKKTCPTCGAVCGVITGDQPDGKMSVSLSKHAHCAGYDGYGQISITYNFPSGKQGPNHPDPGKWYKGITRVAYLPDNKEGRIILEMLKVAFERKLVFTIGRSRTTGQEGVITWNDIHHKTDCRPNSQYFLYYIILIQYSNLIMDNTADLICNIMTVKHESEKLEPVRTTADAAGTEVERLEEKYNGIPVYDAVVTVRKTKDGKLTGDASGTLIQNIDEDLQDTKPKLTNEDTLRIVVKAEGDDIADVTEAKFCRMVYIDKNNTARLVNIINYLVDGVKRPFYIIDVQNGEILKSWQGFNKYPCCTRKYKAWGGNMKMGRITYGDMPHCLSPTIVGGMCYLENEYVRVVDMNNTYDENITYTASFECEKGYGDEVNGAFSPAIDAFFYGTVVGKMFEEWFDSKPLNSKVVIRVHFGSLYENAFWNGENTTFGDGGY
ncbi:uncharacterized protein LOC123544631 [Mercenaria mercenaria]|uniref:uncharacterized protein LOC123544631 n=1 Tax=Mercenaria mercenaria TaxID=6596 RepID=UPI00234E6EF9|nr:uncharacterized protein LOC123544631 [Mercenaria mercenaria]